MIRAKYLAAAAVLSSLIASPVLARDMSRDMNTQSSNTLYQNATYRQSDYRYDVRHHDGFWPGDVAAGVVGGAVGAAGAIATAPFRNDRYTDAYAYDDAYAYGDQYYMGHGPQRHGSSYSYAARNGFICQPGTLVRLEDGQQHLCQ